MKGIYVVCALLATMNIGLVIALTVGHAEAGGDPIEPQPQVQPAADNDLLERWHPQAVGQAQNMIAVMDTVTNNSGVLVVIDTQREIMLSFEVSSQRMRPMSRGESFDLKKTFEQLERARRR
jgi:hypothetical protein